MLTLKFLFYIVSSDSKSSNYDLEFFFLDTSSYINLHWKGRIWCHLKTWRYYCRLLLQVIDRNVEWDQSSHWSMGNLLVILFHPEKWSCFPSFSLISNEKKNLSYYDLLFHWIWYKDLSRTLSNPKYILSMLYLLSACSSKSPHSSTSPQTLVGFGAWFPFIEAILILS